jgi:hypothetical protein
MSQPPESQPPASPLKQLLLDLASKREVRDEYLQNPLEVIDRYLPQEDQRSWFRQRRESGFDPIQISYEFRADLDQQVTGPQGQEPAPEEQEPEPGHEADPDVVVKLKVPPGPTPPPVW